MSLGLWPEAVPFDPDGDTALNELRKHFDPAALPSAVLLVSARNLRDSTWAPKAARGLARALGSSRTVVLVDLDFEQPALHGLIGTANAEGVADALLFGASLERVTLQPAGEPFEFVPAGAFAPEPEQLMAHPGWSRLLTELSARNALLLAWAPLGAPGLDEFAARVSSVVILADDPDITPTVALLPDAIRVEGVIKPPPPPPPPPPPAPPPTPVATPEATGATTVPAQAGLASSAMDWLDAEAEAGDRVRLPKDEAREALMAELKARQPLTPADEPPQTTAGPPPSSRPVAEPEAGESRRRLLWTVAILAVAVVLSWFGGQLLAGGRRTPVASSMDTGTPAEPQPAGDILGFSVAIESYDRLAEAMARGDSLGVAEPGVLFYIVPIQVDSATFYRVMAGPMADSVTADATMHALVARGLKLSASPGDVRSTPLAFEIGRYDLKEDAVNRMTVLKSQGIPSYVVEVPYTRGPARYHVYSGAYFGPSEAAHMRTILRQAGLQDTLVLRVGRISP
jgi:hypothetical protein